MLVCEAAGFDVVIVETVGVGQSEVAVRAMVDLFLVLVIAGAGDEMQGLKKGVMELADAIIVNKADGENRRRCVLAQAEMRRVLHALQPTTVGWSSPAVLASALTGEGLPEVWGVADDYFALTQGSGEQERRRTAQTRAWLRALVDELVCERFYAQPGMRERLEAAEQAVVVGRMPVLAAALGLVEG
jgi:LAO/AO transport system kinase